MESKYLKLSWFVLLIWVTSMSILGALYYSNASAMRSVEELGNSIADFRSSMAFDTPYRSSSADDHELQLQLIYALRLQIESEYETKFLAPDVNQLIYTTDRFLEQARAFVANDLALVELTDEVKFVRKKYRDDPQLQRVYLQLSASVFEAMFSSVKSSPEVYRALDSLFNLSQTLPELERKDLQQLLAKTSSVLGGFAQGKYLTEKLVTHSIHKEMAQLEEKYHEILARFLLASLAVSLFCLLLQLIINYRPNVFTQLHTRATLNESSEEEVKVDEHKDVNKQEPAIVTALEPKLAVGRQIDFSKMLESLNGDTDSVRMLLDVFVQDHKSDVSDIEILLEKDRGSAVRKAHSLKGVGGSLGAHQLRDVACRLEKAIEDESEGVSLLIAELEGYLNKAIEEAEHFLNSEKEKV
ncbi:Hpt domain-containing protein [Vibrio sp. TRT 17S01]|uniref:Hpt domain-containing protein n=1 Tax=Vibrio sp. TRT 17S01 TaxID=3418505 RepID=UPI003CE87D48